MGGTFDPPHIGHLRAAEQVRSALDLDEVLLVVANEPWQKTGSRNVTAAAHRLAMVEAAAEGLRGVRASSIEILRGGPSYMVDTLEWFVANQPDTQLFLIVGADAAAGLDTWHRAHDLPGLATLVVIERPGCDATASPPGWPADAPLERVPVAPVDVSSSEIRDRLRKEQRADGLVPESVLTYVRRHALYGEDVHD